MTVRPTGPTKTRVYVRYSDYGYEGKHIRFATADRDKAFHLDEDNPDKTSFWDVVAVYEDEELCERWGYWDGAWRRTDRRGIWKGSR